MNRRLAVTGLALATALGLGACQTAPSEDGDTPAPTAAATAGATDPAAAKELTAAATKLGDDMYMRFTGGLANVMGKKWMHLDAADLKAGSNFAVLPQDDPTGAQSLAKAVTQVAKQGDTYTGVIDITKAPSLNKDSLKALGAKSNTVPFTAKVDGSGRLVEMNVDMSAIAPTAGTMKTTYSDFGTKVKVSKPPADQVTEPPKELAGLLNA